MNPSPKSIFKFGPGRYASARFFLPIFALSLGALPVDAQVAQPRPPAPAATIGPPDLQTINKLVWSTIAAVDHGNVTGNYSVLRDLGAPSFQANNNAATLANVFQGIRNQRFDLASTLLLAPSYEFAPTFQGGVLRARGAFGMRPIGVGFDLLFSSTAGRWQLLGIAVVLLPLPTVQSSTVPTPGGR